MLERLMIEAHEQIHDIKCSLSIEFDDALDKL